MIPIWRLWRGDARVDAIDPGDRGFAYGDGLFETILVHRGVPVWWDAHMARLALGCARLGIPNPHADFLRHQADALIDGRARGVLKLILTRGVGARGYAPPTDALSTVAMCLSDPPPLPPRAGLTLRWCATPLAIQPRLAGIKHLNRLEQVLARAEWSDADPDTSSIHEGLMCDTSGRVVAATSANLFVLRDGRWLTPPVADCGIAGICRGWILDHIQGAGEATLSRADVESADAVILCNAVRGILAVAAVGQRRWAMHEAVRGLRAALALAEPAFAAIESAASESL
ncbi:MAG: aminodeoxychorismate lyase [Proteobacteria bacterium]|nr:aminodeoxychorismate lyase [Pseudomonadota bacterium]MBS0462901.1 aminodeoxychorismate lyase [Pseudomonadota bacterium]MBS0463546.1 aminodeoxychorismate lyase [Pseudomonadota bacterium]